MARVRGIPSTELSLGQAAINERFAGSCRPSGRRIRPRRSDVPFLKDAMAFEAFRHYLTAGHRSVATGRPLGPHAAGDYPSRLRRLEGVLQASLENAPPMVLRSLADDLRQDPRVAATVPRKVMGDIAVALRAYANYLDGPMNVARPDVTDADPAPGTHAILADLRALGFVTAPTGSKKIIETSRDGLVLYAMLDSPHALIVHPVFEEFYSFLTSLTGMGHQSPVRFYHDAGLSKFPRRNNGQGLIHYGIAFGITDKTALQYFIDELQDALPLASPLSPERAIRDEMQTSETESTVLAKARLGQGRFRADLLNFWQGQCALTDVSAPELLRASHIKSWSDSNDHERLDAFNGLLLAVHLDALFDNALITFRDSGEMLVSKRLTAQERDVFGIAPPARKLLLNVPHIGYMRHHRERFSANEQKYQPFNSQDGLSPTPGI